MYEYDLETAVPSKIYIEVPQVKQLDDLTVLTVGNIEIRLDKYGLLETIFHMIEAGGIEEEASHLLGKGSEQALEILELENSLSKMVSKKFFKVDLFPRPPLEQMFNNFISIDAISESKPDLSR